MKKFCENRHCENPGFKLIPVSVDKPSDQTRTLCATCEEAYTWGVQHGEMIARGEPCLPNVQRFLKKNGFMVLGKNQTDPSLGGAVEAWAYKGPLDFKLASPLTFGVGPTLRDALTALDLQLATRKPSQVGGQSLPGLTIEPPPEETGKEPLYRVAYVIDVNASDVRRAAERAYQVMTDPESMAPVLQVIDHKGKTTVIDLSKTDRKRS
jgi:hypothetical protein